MKKRILINQKFTAHLISKSVTTDIDTLLDASDINCYAASRMLTYPDVNRQYYAPGRLYNLCSGGKSKFVTRFNNDLEFFHDCIMKDSIILNQPCTRVSFCEIEENDEFHYFGLCKSRIIVPKYVQEKLADKIVDDWHFIFRLPSGIWLHKPGFEQSVDRIDWIEEGSYFESVSYSKLVNLEMPVAVTCFPNMFYRLNEKYELSMSKDDF